jgi:hypothetical protein
MRIIFRACRGLISTMNAEDVVQCSSDPTHDAFDRLKKLCGVCESPLKKKCGSCSKMVSYSNAARHVKKCKGGGRKRRKEDDEEDEDEKVALRVGYVCSNWDIASGVMPSGQYCSSLHDDFPAHFQKLVIDDPTAGDVVTVDAYDAIWGTLFASKPESFALVKTFRCLDDVFKKKIKSNIDMLVTGNWAHPVALSDDINGHGLALDMYHRLQELEIQERIRIFPPLDYVWYFAQKVHYYNKLSCMRFPTGAHVIPTIAVSKENNSWKKKLQEFARELNVKELMLKRELSEMTKHTIKMKVNSLQSLEGRRDGFHWMAQPVLEEFSLEPEFRMFVINGECRWGVSTQFANVADGGVVFEKTACAPGRKAWEVEGGKEAAAVAEGVVKAVSQDMIHSDKFLRVDMVKKRGGGWWINELEYFGNAFIHFESFDNSSEMLDQLVECIHEWILP